jgi:branched-chain amino acid transport system substrate-binding protein
MKQIYLAVALILFVVSCTTGEAIKEDTIKIGVVTPLSGKGAIQGEWTQRGLEIALSEINLPIQLVYEDSQFNPQKALDATKKLVEVDNVPIVITSSGASSALSILPYTNSKQIIQMEILCISPDCHTRGDYLFRVTGDPKDQAVALSNHLGIQKVAVLWMNNDYGLSQKRVFESVYQGEIVASEKFEQGETEFRTEITKLAATQPDAILFVGYFVETGHFLKQVGELGVDVTTVGTIPSQNEQVLSIADKLADGHMYSYFNVDTGSSYRAKYIATYGEEPEAIGAKSYDALHVLAKAVNVCGRNTVCLHQTIPLIQFQGASNYIRFDEYGDLAEEKYQIKKIENGKFIMYTSQQDSQ